MNTPKPYDQEDQFHAIANINNHGDTGLEATLCPHRAGDVLISLCPSRFGQQCLGA